MNSTIGKFIGLACVLAIAACGEAAFRGKSNKKDAASTNGASATAGQDPQESNSPAAVTPAASTGFDFKVHRKCNHKGTFYPFVGYYSITDATSGVIVKVKDSEGKITAYATPQQVMDNRKSITEKGSLHFDLPVANYTLTVCDARHERCKDPSRFDSQNVQFDDNGVISNGVGKVVVDPATQQIDTKKSFLIVHFMPIGFLGDLGPLPSPNCDGFN